MVDGRTKKLERAMLAGDREVRGMVKRGQRTIRGIVSEYSSSPRFATNAALRNSMYTALAKEYEKFGGQINEWTKTSAESTARDFWLYAKEDMALKGTFGSFSGKYIEDILGQINPSTVGDLVAVNAQVGGMAYSDIRALRGAVSTTIAEGSIEGLTNKQLADRMKLKVGEAAGKFQFVDRAGKKWKADNYFGMLNRTLHANVARHTYAMAGTEAGFDLYVIAGGVTGSSAEHPDDPCDRWAGRPISYTGNTKGVATYDEALAAGVFHPNCVHTIRAVTRSEAKEAGLEHAKTPATKLDKDNAPMIDTKAKAKTTGAEFVPAKTVKEAEEIIVNSGAVKSADFEGLHIDAVNDYNKTIIDLHSRFKSELVSVNPNEFEQGVVASVSRSKANMRLNEEFYGDPAAWNARRRMGLSMGWGIRTKKGISATRANATHEFAHTIATEIDVIGSEFMKPVAGLSKIPKLYDDYKKQLSGANPVKISKYAEKNMSEFMAESFLKAELGESVDEFSSAVYAIIKKEYGK